MIFLLCVYVIGFSVAIETRIDCHPEPNATPDACLSRNCIWKTSDEKTAPWCFMKKDVGYTSMSVKVTVEGTITALKKKGPDSPWGPDIQKIFFFSKTIGKTLNVKIYVPGRYEPPVELPLNPSYSYDELELLTENIDGLFSFTVLRSSTKEPLFNTSLGGLIFSDKFLQIAAYLPSDRMYGWGEHVHPSLKHSFTKYTTWPMFARDEPPYSDDLSIKNLYGVHPFYMMIEKDSKAHGVFILNSNAQEVVTAPGPSIIYRTIGGNLDMYFFPGPLPEDVTRQYLALIGTPFLPSYWALGFQISRYGYSDLTELKSVIAENINYSIPLDTVVVDIDYMDRYKDFTIGKKFAGLPEYVEELHSKGMRTVLIFDPAIQVNHDSFERAMKMNARFIEWERNDQVMRSVQDIYPSVKDKKIMLGVVWPDEHVAFPDFLDTTSGTSKWWIEEFVKFHEKVKYDGIWIDMNEPANFGTNEEHPWYFDSPDHPNITTLKCGKDDWEEPPYETQSVYQYWEGNKRKNNFLATKTLCMSAVQAGGTHRFYNVKNLYGWSESKVTLEAQYSATKKRGAVISRSTFPSSGRFSGHWLGDNTAKWVDLRSAVIGIQEFNMFGIPYVGSDICGFNGDVTEELCLRWQQFGAFSPFMRNHNAIRQSRQDPAVWPSVASATVKANQFRYRYLPYLFSLHFIASMYGGTVVRPLFYEYPTDTMTYDLNFEFLWGSSMLIAPVVFENATSVNVYLPEDDWYSLYDYNYSQIIDPGNHNMPAPQTSLIPVFITGGTILPRQKPEVTTEFTRKNAFELLIAPGAQIRTEGKAYGFLYWDDGESIVKSFSSHNYYQWEFFYSVITQNASLTIRMTHKADSLLIPTLDILEIFNYAYYPDPNSFTLNGEEIAVNIEYNKKMKILNVSSKNLINLSNTDEEQRLTWEHSIEPIYQTESLESESPSTVSTSTTPMPSTSTSTTPMPSTSTSTTPLSATSTSATSLSATSTSATSLSATSTSTTPLSATSTSTTPLSATSKSTTPLVATSRPTSLPQKKLKCGSSRCTLFQVFFLIFVYFLLCAQ